jgi:hypothetical protein
MVEAFVVEVDADEESEAEVSFLSVFRPLR